MLSIVILDSGEPNVIKLTYENLFREIKSIPDGELLVEKDWFNALDKIHNKYVCFVEPDCLVSGGYFASQMGLFNKSGYTRKLAMMSSAIGINNWANRIYGFKLDSDLADGIIPVKEKTSNSVHPVQMGFVPGSIIRVSMLRKALEELKITSYKDTNLVALSAEISLAFWKQGDGNRVHINPNSTYVTTEDYVGDIFNPSMKLKIDPSDLIKVFKRELI